MALSFNGSNQYVIKNSDLGITGGVITLSIWVKLNAEISSGEWCFVSQIDAGTHVKYAIDYKYNSGTRQLSFYRTRYTVVDNQATYNITLGTSNWYHLVLTYDGSNVKGYVNGVLQAGPTASSGNGTSRGSDCFVVASEDGASLYANATLFDARCYNRVITDNEISEIYHKRGADRVWQGLVGRWRLDEKTSGTLAEHTDVAPHNMTSNNSPSPYVASANNELEGKAAYRAFDGSNSVWGSSGTSGWLKLDYGAGNAPVLIGYAIKSYEDPAFQNVMPKNWTFKGSNNDTDWTTLDTRTNITGWTASAWKEFWFSNSTGYRYYMIDISANNGYALCTYIAEMRHFTSPHRILDRPGNGNHGTPYNSPTYQASPHRLRRGVIVS